MPGSHEEGGVQRLASHKLADDEDDKAVEAEAASRSKGPSAAGEPRLRRGDADLEASPSGPVTPPLGQRLSLEPQSSQDEVLRFKDLDTGKEYNVQQKYTIRDLTTGQVFVLDSSGAESARPASDTGSPRSAHVTDVVTGKEMSLDEFDQALGLHNVLEAARRARQRGGEHASSSSDADGGGGKATGAAVRGSTAAAKGQKGAGSWLKKRLFNRSSRTAADAESDDSHESQSPAYSKAEADSVDFSRHGGAASPSGRGSRGEGRPVKVHVHRKLVKELTDLCLVQDLPAHSGVVWAMKFSKNGKYLASAGQDTVVRVWEVCLDRGGSGAPTGSAAASPRSPHSSDTTRSGPPDASPGDDNGVAASAAPADARPAAGSNGGSRPRPVLGAVAFRTFTGHSADVLDLAWSRSQFLLSASMDKTVRLWHISMDQCLREFRHTDFVTALDFHPIDDKFFASGSIDGKLRVWNIPGQRVVDWADVHEMVTATAFAPDGRRAVVGTMKGRCRFYTCEAATHKLEYAGQLDVKNRRGKQSRGRKITGMQFLPGLPTHLLITSNDSRIRLYDGFEMRTKYKGHHNRNTQIRATFNAGGDFLISGSDNGWVYVWNVGPAAAPPPPGVQPATFKREKSASYECFHAHDDIVTVALFAPDTARRPTPPAHPSSPPKASGVAESLARLTMRSGGGGLSREETAEATVAGEAAVAAGLALGHVVLTAGYSGEIKVFENFAPPQWL